MQLPQQAVPTVSVGSYTAQNLAFCVPPNAVKVRLNITGAASASNYVDISLDGVNTYMAFTATGGWLSSFRLITPQTLWYLGNVANAFNVIGFTLNI